jgi:hypothetical protein
MTDKQKPIFYQYRTRPATDDKYPWSAWRECHESIYKYFLKVPVLNDWAYEVRALYTHPAPTRQPLTDDQITLIIGECAARHEHTDYGFARAIEAAHGIGGEK